MRLATLSAAWGAWCDHVTACQHKQSLLQRATSFLLGSTLSRAFSTWRANAVEQRQEDKACKNAQKAILLKVRPAFYPALPRPPASGRLLLPCHCSCPSAALGKIQKMGKIEKTSAAVADCHISSCCRLSSPGKLPPSTQSN
jgi:hypothetical protein